MIRRRHHNSRMAGPLPSLLLTLALLFQSLMYASVVECHEEVAPTTDTAATRMVQHGDHGAPAMATSHGMEQMADEHECHCPPAGCIQCAGDDCSQCLSAGAIGPSGGGTSEPSRAQSLSLPFPSAATGNIIHRSWQRPPGRAPPINA